MNTTANSANGIDDLIKFYLQARGYQKALEALEQETTGNNNHLVTQPSSSSLITADSTTAMEVTDITNVDHKGGNGVIKEKNIEKLLLNAAESLCFLGVKQGDVLSYRKEYDVIHSWMNQSLDTIRPYLQAINFALFVYCYIGLIRFGEPVIANEFWNIYHYGFMIYFQNEMDQLILLQSKDQLEDEEFLKANTFINCVIHDKFIIYLNSFTFNLFTYFLSHHELILLASIINDKIIFQKINHDQQSNLDIDCNSLLQLQNYTPGHNESSSSSNPLFQKIALGVPGTGELLQILREKSLLFREIMIPDLRKDQIYKVWIDKLIRPKATLMKILQNTPSSSSSSSGPSSSIVNNVNTNNLDEARKKLQRVTSSPVATSSIAPAPALNASPQKAGKPDDSAMEVANSSSSATNKEEPADNTWTSLEVNPRSYTSHSIKANPLEPSIIFGTISNCDEGLISLRLNPTVTQAVSGFRDSIVRVWRLDENANDAYDDSKSYQSAFGKILKGGMYDLNEVIPKPKEAFNSEYTYQQNRQFTQNHKRFSNGRSGGGMDAGSRRRYPMIEFKGHSGPVYSVDQNCTDRVILSSSADESIRLWDTAILQCVGKYVCSSIAWDVQFNPILDYYFASANQDGSVSLYATDRTVPIRMMTGHISDVNCLSWHGNNTFLASGSDDRTVRLWDIRSAQCNRLLKGSNSPITSISICGVGNLLAAGNEMGKIYLYDLRTSRVLSVLHGHDSTVYSLAFNEDISTLVSGSHDCSVRIWDLYPAYDTTFVSSAAYQVNAPIVGNETTTPSNTPSTSVLGGVLGGSIGSQSASLENYVTKVIKSRHSFFTKASPVYHVGFTSENLVYAGGPCSFETAASSREKYLFQTNQGSGGHTNTSSSNKTVITEQEAVNILGISEPTTSNGQDFRLV